MGCYSGESSVTCFKLIKNILEELYGQLPSQDEKYKDEIIQKQLKNLYDDYKKPVTDFAPNYNNLYKCFAYTYKYATAHANAIYQLIKRIEEIVCIFGEKKRIQASLLGGGPGCDLLGIHKFMVRSNMFIPVVGRIYDREKTWQGVLPILRRNLRILVQSSFEYLDATDRRTWEDTISLWESDMFIMSYFISELYSLNGRRKLAEEFLIDVFRKSRCDSVFLFIDRYDAQTCMWFDSLVDRYNFLEFRHYLRCLDRNDKYPFRMERSEDKEHLGRFFEKFKKTTEPLLETTFRYRIYCKD